MMEMALYYDAATDNVTYFPGLTMITYYIWPGYNWTAIFHRYKERE